ncbi:tetratricopeptide repeat protein [Fibrobacter sp.]|uniref:tetratricopeptide repeat protein n=1 Tax=Fibrobacter sp. TaxID=35828 RepID=UPI00345CE524
MGVYNIVIGNKSEAIAYFKQILKANPEDFRTRSMLAQIYLLTGKEDKALHLFNENERYLPESAGMALQSTTKAFIYYLQEKYDESEEVAAQVVLFHPETPLARLIVIACKNRKGDFEQSESHIKKFFEYHPHFKKSDLEKLLSGIAPSKKNVILSCISNVFP